MKRVRNFMIPVLVLFLVRTIYELRSSWDDPLFVAKAYVKNSLDIFSGMEYWFIFSLFGFLVVAPFLARMIQGLTDYECKVFVGIGLAWQALLVVVTNMGLDFGWGYLFSGFAFAFCLGALMDRQVFSSVGKGLVFFVTFACLIADVFLRIIGWDYGSLDVSPLYTLFSVGLYAGILELGEKMKPWYVISFMARHSFSVYLIHMMVLWSVVARLPKVSGFLTMLEHVAVTLFVFAVSLLLAVVVGAILVKPCQKLFDRVTGFFGL